jgi:spermidine synthase
MSPQLKVKILVFASGFVSLGVEITASRLMERAFGSTLWAWSTLIGLILSYLSLGYLLGGKLADKFPSPALLYRLAFLAGLFTGFIPFAAPALFTLISSTGPAGSLPNFISLIAFFLGMALLLAVPVTLMGSISPFALRLSIRDIGEAGESGGTIFALSTVGSILGTFVSPFILIPFLGTTRTFLALALILIAASFLGIAPSARGRTLLYLLLATATLPLGLKAKIYPPARGQVLFEGESPYNYVWVIQSGQDIYLMLNEGFGVQSLYNPEEVLTGGIWDYFLLAPLFNPPPFSPAEVKSLCLIGLAGGTISRLYTQIYGPITIDGVEIDPLVVEAARKFMALDSPNLKVAIDDGRHYLSRSAKIYDVIAVDAYRPPYIPYHLTTREFFQEVLKHLSPRGVVAVNVAHTPSDYRLVNAIASTMASVFPSVYVIDEPPSDHPIANSLIVGTASATRPENFPLNVAFVENPYLLEVAKRALPEVKIFVGGSSILTDDHAPVEHLTHLTILDYLRGKR